MTERFRPVLTLSEIQTLISVLESADPIAHFELIFKLEKFNKKAIHGITAAAYRAEKETMGDRMSRSVREQTLIRALDEGKELTPEQQEEARQAKFNQPADKIPDEDREEYFNELMKKFQTL